MARREVGRTLGAGYQIGVRRTLPIDAARAWELVVSPRGRRLWLGDVARMRLAAGAAFRTADGATGEIRVLVPGSHLRLTRQPGEWPRPSTVQVRVIPRDGKAVVAFHEEHLPGAREREARRAYYAAALDELERIGAGS